MKGLCRQSGWSEARSGAALVGEGEAPVWPQLASFHPAPISAQVGGVPGYPPPHHLLECAPSACPQAQHFSSPYGHFTEGKLSLQVQ